MSTDTELEDPIEILSNHEGHEEYCLIGEIPYCEKSVAALLAWRDRTVSERMLAIIDDLDTHYWDDDDTDTYMNMKLEPYIARLRAQVMGGQQ